MKRTFEIWTSDDRGSAMFMKGAKVWRESLSQDYKLLRTFEAESRFDAFRIYYDLMGWGEWTPPEGVQDLQFTGDDSHDLD
ncbi:MAG: hypothetical protein JSR55_02915 [Proteobacteria bacterium]|nr:hypothetical protein [Pseudomonadota bacterium]